MVIAHLDILQELISTVLHSRVGRSAKTYLYQLCSDTGYSLEDLS